MSRKKQRFLASFLAVAAVAGSLYLRPLSFVDAATHVKLWRSGVRSRYISAGGHRMHYFEAPAAPNGGGVPLLLIHGLGARSEDWVALIPGLSAAGFHVYAPDLLGYGRSDMPDASYTIAYEEAAVGNFLDAMHLERVNVAGWSMGGWVAMRLTADHPERVDRLVLYDSAGVYFPMNYDTTLFTPTDQMGLQTLWNRLTPKHVQLPGFVARDFLRRSAPKAWVIQRSVAGMTSGRDLMDFRLGEIHRPTAVMWGMRDELIPPIAGQKIARGVPGAVFFPIEGCGHLAPAECPSQVLPATIRFLQSGRPPH